MRKITEKEMCKAFGHLEDHQYRHFNRALGCKVEGKEHFKKLLSERNMVPIDIGSEMAEKAKESRHKPYILSNKAKQLINSAKLLADRKGNIKVGDRLVDGMRELGVDLVNRNVPSHYRIDMGGFCDATHKGE